MNNHRKSTVHIKLLKAGMLLGILLARGSAVQALPSMVQSLSVTPNRGSPGITVTITGSGYYTDKAQLLWDGVMKDWVILEDKRTFSKNFTIPPGASAGAHTITVCWGNPCDGPREFPQVASTTFTVIHPTDTPRPPGRRIPSPTPVPTLAPTVPPPRFNVQVQAIEITQGIRGDIPTRAAPGGDMVLRPEDAVHVANRRTVVRVYPWVEVEEGGSVPPLTALLYGGDGDNELPGSPLSPVNYFLTPTPGESIESMRANEALSWNFILPSSWVQSGTISLAVEINPPGPDHQIECAACSGDNHGNLYGNTFQVVQTEEIDMRIYLADLHYYDLDGTTVLSFSPSWDELVSGLNAWMKVWPIDVDLWRIRLRTTSISQNPPGIPPEDPVREVDPPIPGAPQWDNDVYLDENADITVPPWLTRPYAYIPLVFSPASWVGCSGTGGVGGPPLFHAGACGDNKVFAHEAGHTLGRTHTGHTGGDDPNYPGTHGEIEANAYGFDVWDLRAYPPTASEGDGSMHDFMSYGGPNWVSLYTWEAIAAAFGAPDIQAGLNPSSEDWRLTSNAWMGSELQTRRDYLRLSGEIHEDGTVFLNTAYHLNLPEGAGDYPGEGSYSITLLDSAGQVLFRRNFEPNLEHGSGALAFYEPVPVVAEVQTIAFEKDGISLGSVLVSENAPVVNLLTPAQGDRWEASGVIMLNWQGTDADGDTVWYRVEASPDGRHWFNLVNPTTLTQAPLDLSIVPGYGENWRVRVQASDGVNASSDVVDGITIAPKAPQVLILMPLTGDFIPLDKPFSVLGKAWDDGDGSIPKAALEWLLDGEQVATGESATIPGLNEGSHTLTLRATNSQGLTGEMSIALLSAPDKDGDRLPDSWESENGLDPADPVDAAQDIDDDGLRNWEEFKYASDPNSTDSDGDSVPDGREVAGGSDPADPDSIPAAAFGSALPQRQAGNLVTGDDFQESDQELDSERDEVTPRPGALGLALIVLALLAGLGLGLGLIVSGLRRK